MKKITLFILTSMITVQAMDTTKLRDILTQHGYTGIIPDTFEKQIELIETLKSDDQQNREKLTHTSAAPARDLCATLGMLRILQAIETPLQTVK